MKKLSVSLIALSVLFVFFGCKKLNDSDCSDNPILIGGKGCRQDQWIFTSESTGIVSSPDHISYSPTSFGGSGKFDYFEDVEIKVATPFTGTGFYPITYYFSSNSSSPVYMAGLFDGTSALGGTVKVASFGQVGGYMSGTFSVPCHTTYGDTAAADQIEMTGYFQVKRTQ